MTNKLIEAIDEQFCAAVWEALKGDHNDLRQQQIILAAHRESRLASLEAALEDGQDTDGCVAECMRSVLKSWKTAGVKCSPDLEASELAARAALRALIQQVAS